MRMMIMESILDFAGKDGIELLLRDKTIMVSVGSVDELLQLLFGHVFAEFLSNSSEVFDGDESGALIIEEGKNLVDVGSGVLIIDSFGHEGNPLSEIDGSASVGVKVGKHLENGSVFGLKSQRGHGCLKLYISRKVPLISTDPPWSRSNKSNAALTAATSYSVTPFLAQALGSKPAFLAGSGALACWGTCFLDI